MYEGVGTVFVALLAAAAVAGAAVLALILWLGPMLWEWVKPWLHTITA